MGPKFVIYRNVTERDARRRRRGEQRASECRQNLKSKSDWEPGNQETGFSETFFKKSHFGPTKPATILSQNLIGNPGTREPAFQKLFSKILILVQQNPRHGGRYVDTKQNKKFKTLEKLPNWEFGTDTSV